MSTAAILVAAGQSRRMGFDKLFAELGSTPVLAHSLRTFQKAGCIDEIIVVTSNDKLSMIADWTNDHGLTKLTRVIPGGSLRHLSVMEGLKAVHPKTKFVAVHDGARPLLAVSDLERCCKLAKTHGAAACARRITDTVKRVDGNHRVTGSVDRTNLWAMETPQIFDLQLLMNAYDFVCTQNALVTDEVSAAELLGEAVHLSENLKPNLKITFPQDLELATQLLAMSDKPSCSS
ncbi:MAG: 2-C-methyl-D-erythritol 4-phosphate cytidylyltransferase [Verrucomicrobiaceae bacterium]|nr:2-C-methyl-D-erythritol 4-phosphate cytidylyltransferase [Verrucomicrobiaceae bacterium]